jgi:hypothetical protein
MGDFSAIAAVTRTMVQVVQDGINRCEGDIARATVTTNRPDRTDPNPQPRVNLFLFHVVPNPSLRNEDLPSRTPAGLIRRPSIALDLYYLVSFYGNDEVDRTEPQILMGATMSALNAQPILTPDAIMRAAALFNSTVDERFTLAQVQVTLQNMSVEELSRLWTTFPQVPYALSICYRASAVLLEADETPAPSLPIQGAGFAVGARPPPTIASVRGAGEAPPAYGAPLTIVGRDLAGEEVVVLLGGAVLRPASVAPDMLTVVAVGQGVTAGLQSLHVGRDGMLSRGVAVALAPLLTDIQAVVKPDDRRGFSGAARLTLEPAVQPGQGVTLELFPARASLLDLRRSYRFEWTGRDSSGRARAQVSVRVQGVAGGRYMARVTVDGAASLLTQDARGRYNGPIVTIGPTAQSSP